VVNRDGNVYLLDSLRRQVHKFTGPGQKLQTWGGTRGSGSGDFRLPTGLALDITGNVYVTDAKNQRFQVFDANGRFLARGGGPGTGEGQFDAPEGIAIDDEGNVYVVDTGNHRVQVFAPVP